MPPSPLHQSRQHAHLQLDVAHSRRHSSTTSTSASGLALSPRDLTGSPDNSPFSPTQSTSGPLSPVTVGNGSAARLTGPMNGAWDVPQRPKPGRKPATDTPPSKRKAQNRAAQRAFRERRAARIGELEEEKKQVQDEKTRLETRYEGVLSQALQAVRLECAQEIAHWRSRAEAAERQLAEERRKSSAAKIAPSVRQSSASAPAGLPIGGPRPSNSPTQLVPRSEGSSLGSGCDDCVDGGSCACVDDMIDDTAPAGSTEVLPSIGTITSAASLSPVTDVQMTDRPAPDPFSPIDFTTYKRGPPEPVRASLEYTRKSSSLSDVLNSDESCGFCTDLTNCICRAEREGNPHGKVRVLRNMNKLPPMLSLVDESHTAPATPSSERLTPQAAEPPLSAMGPGSCQECLTNPEQRLFCQTLARERPIPQPVAPRSLQSPSQTSAGPGARPTGLPSPRQSSYHDTIPCAEAYKVLKDQAFPVNNGPTDWMRTILTLPSAGESARPGANGPSFGKVATAYEVDCASILTTLNAKGKG